MGNKKLQKSINTVKGDVRELVEAFWAFRGEVMTQEAMSAAERQSEEKQPTPSDLPQKSSGDMRGHIQASGYYEIPDEDGQTRVHRWKMEAHPVEDVLSIPVDDTAMLFDAIGHRQRLAIVRLLLGNPATASEMVANLELGTSGAAYHHLNVLQGSGLVQREQRGVFSIVPERIPSLLTILGGVSGQIEASVEQVPAGDEESSPEPENE